MSFLTKIFGDANERFIKSLSSTMAAINQGEEKIKRFSAADFVAKTEELKKRLADKDFDEQQKILAEILPEAFALVREAAVRTLGQRHYDVQLMSGMVLHGGKITEMKTGEGKTLAATTTVYLNALTGRGAHVITVNDYLARRDTVWMGQIYNYLGLTVGCLNHEIAYLYLDSSKSQIPNPKSQTNSKSQIQNSKQNLENKKNNLDEKRDIVGGFKVVDEFLKPVERKEAYQADITYGTNNEFGFDYLRDNMVQSLEQKVQRELHYAIVDEVDSILIDEARTPLIISAPDTEPTDKYHLFAQLATRLRENEDYNIDEKMRVATFTEEGQNKIVKNLGYDPWAENDVKTTHQLDAALKAKTLFQREKEYVIKDGEVIIVDEFTGRLMFGRRYSEGLHQAIEAKEGVTIKQESVTMATITFQNYFRMYKKLAGMTGTAATEAEEFAKIYNLDVIQIPTHKPMVRTDKQDAIYKTTREKYAAIIEKVKELHNQGQPVLVGTISIENNETLAQSLERAGVPYNILNAKNHEREAEIIAQAGKLGGVTIATNMAGRGVDIVLGGNPPLAEEQAEVIKLGGLYVVGTERHESRRIDNQLRGRAGRQGDPGSSQFFVSMEDDLMRIFGGERMKNLMQTLGLPEGMPIENKMISNAIEKAQQKVEGYNFDIRKHLVEYDDVINKHREVIYKKRNQVLGDESNKEIKEIKGLKDTVLNYLKEEIEAVVNFHTQVEPRNIKEIIETVNSIVPLAEKEQEEIKDIKGNTIEIKEYLIKLLEQKYQELENKINSDEVLKKQLAGLEPMRLVEKTLLLRAIDMFWVEHIDFMDHMRRGIGLVGYGQKDPLVEYKKEAYRMFNELLTNIRRQIVYSIFKVGLVPQQNQQKINSRQSAVVKTGEKKVGRNDPCPCGSGKKFKKCCGR